MPNKNITYLCALFILFSVTTSSFAQQIRDEKVWTEIVKYKISIKGEPKVVPNWGIDTTWINYYNARASIKHAGDQIGFIRVGFFMNEPTNKDGSLSKGQIEKLDATMKFVKMVGDEIPVMMSPSNLGKIVDWYKNPAGSANIKRWMNVIRRSKEYFESKGHKVIAIEY